ncbi:spore coat U domain-containing protein [Idiomarina xiamenensis]|uniref:Spore coat U domain-containing protein n=1 Tax=Idiomarina xiamenensis 10-D-4 TaxID=740709 RepID=K2K695_9GAMM|nr:spore coat U domain-containing protein [Idiomarina xiamenensis]EKE82112.1 spore coat U domain-containing protein [Idiomarina xiamenensis 10-D-4]
MKITKTYATLALTSTLFFAGQLQADQITGTMGVTAVIGDGCQVDNVSTGGGSNDFGTLDFGTLSSLTAYIDAQGGGAAGAGFQFTCTSGLPYQIGLDTGLYASGGDRRMSDGSNFIPYELYQDSARSVPWGEIGSADQLTSSGTGSQQTHVVYGRIPPTTTPPAGTYNDTVQVTVTW